MKTGWRLQVFRKAVQIASVAFVVYAALGMHWRNFKEAHNSSRIVALMTNDLAGEAYWRNEQVLSLFGDPVTVSEGFLGGPWAASVGGVLIVDPFAVAAIAVAGHLPPLAMLVGAALPVLLAVALGRVFCSFLCPARLAFELGNGVRRGLLWLGVPLPEVRLPRVGLWVGAGAVLFAASAGPAVFHFVLPYLSISSAILAWVMTGAVMATAAWMVALVVFDALVAPGQFCHALCPTGAVLEQLGRGSRLVLARSGGACPPSCDVCQRACPYGLYPGKLTHRPACDTCGRCVVACPQRKLSHRVRWPWRRAAAVVAVLAGALVASSAYAHHNKGLPHYGYFENYPQVPTEEFIDEVGRWEVGMVMFNFQGLNRRTSDTPNDIRVFAYAYDLEADKGYHGPLSLRIERDGDTVAAFTRLEPDQEGVYVVRQEMPASGRYTLVFGLDDGSEVDLPFEVDLAADRVQWGVLGGGAGLLALLFLVAALGRKQKAARRAPAAQVE